MGLSLRMEPTPGTHVNEALEGSFRIAVTLGLASVRFDFNEMHIAVYPAGSAIALNTETAKRWRRVGPQGWMEQ